MWGGRKSQTELLEVKNNQNIIQNSVEGKTAALEDRAEGDFQNTTQRETKRQNVEEERQGRHYSIENFSWEVLVPETANIKKVIKKVIQRKRKKVFFFFFF